MADVDQSLNKKVVRGLIAGAVAAPPIVLLQPTTSIIVKIQSFVGAMLSRSLLAFVQRAFERGTWRDCIEEALAACILFFFGGLFGMVAGLLNKDLLAVIACAVPVFIFLQAIGRWERKKMISCLALFFVILAGTAIIVALAVFARRWS